MPRSLATIRTELKVAERTSAVVELYQELFAHPELTAFDRSSDARYLMELTLHAQPRVQETIKAIGMREWFRGLFDQEEFSLITDHIKTDECRKIISTSREDLCPVYCQAFVYRALAGYNIGAHTENATLLQATIIIATLLRTHNDL